MLPSFPGTYAMVVYAYRAGNMDMQGSGMVLPFDPMRMTFKDLHYFVHVPKVHVSFPWQRVHKYMSVIARKDTCVPITVLGSVHSMWVLCAAAISTQVGIAKLTAQWLACDAVYSRLICYGSK